MEKKIKKHSIIWTIGLIILLLIIQSTIYLIIEDLISNAIIVNLFTYIISCLLLIVIFYKLIITDIKNFKKDINGHIKEIILSFIIFLVLEIISNYLISNYLKDISINEQTNISLLKISPLLSSIYLILFGPISEELIIKIPFKLADNNKLISFIMITLIFTLLHIIGSTDTLHLLYFIPYLFLSLSINYGYYKTNNLCVPIILHIINNIFSIMITFIF